MRPIGTRDLLVLAVIVALHFAACKLAVDFRGHGVVALKLLIPILLTAALQSRFKLPWPRATALHYPVALVWAFLDGATYSMYWNRVPHDFFERDSVGMDTPLSYGLFCTQVWMFVGIISTAIYGIVAWLISRRSNRIVKTRITDEQ